MRIRRIESGYNSLPLRLSLEKLKPQNSGFSIPLRCHRLWTRFLTFLSGKLTVHRSPDSDPSPFLSNFLLFTTPPPTTPFLLVFFLSRFYVFLSQHIIILVSPTPHPRDWTVLSLSFPATIEEKKFAQSPLPYHSLQSVSSPTVSVDYGLFSVNISQSSK